MTPITRITRDVMDGHDGSDVAIFNDRLDLIGVLKFEKGTSRLELAPGMAPYRTWPLKKKYRQR